MIKLIYFCGAQCGVKENEFVDGTIKIAYGEVRVIPFGFAPVSDGGRSDANLVNAHGIPHDDFAYGAAIDVVNDLASITIEASGKLNPLTAQARILKGR